MSKKEVSNRKMKEILRLHFGASLSIHKIARSLNLSSGVVHKYIARAKMYNIGWPLPKEWEDEEKLMALLRPPKTPVLVMVDWVYVHAELKRKGVTLQLLYEELQMSQQLAMSYSTFCKHYKKWKKQQPLSMRQTHVGGDKVFVDYSGKTLTLIDPHTSELKSAEIFIGVLGASNYTYAEATWSQTLPDWIGSHVRMFEYFGGVPHMVVPDNLKSAVKKSCRYEPDINPSYAECIAHYNSCVLPARPYKPKDKAKVENGVLVVQRWILARLRHHRFIGLAELNKAIRELLDVLNNRPFKKIPGTRRTQFESLDNPHLKPLPATSFDYKAYKIAKVNIDYHVELAGHYYSVPCRYVGAKIELRFNHRLIECYSNGKQIALHQRSYKKGQHTTVHEHMPKKHQQYSRWSRERFINWGEDIGPATADMVKCILDKKSHDEQGYRAVLGLLNLANRYSKTRLESACNFALANNLQTRKSVTSILSKKLDQQTLLTPATNTQNNHHNIRGATYYH